MFSCRCIIELHYRHILLQTSLDFFFFPKNYLKGVCMLLPSYVSVAVSLPFLVLENNHELSAYKTLAVRSRVIILVKCNQLTK